MEPVSISMVILTSVLVLERVIKYYIKHIKKSKCMGSEVEFRSAESIKKINDSTISDK